MLTVLLAVATSAIVVLTAAFIVFIRAFLLEMRRISDAIGPAAREVAETAREARIAFHSVDKAVSAAGETLARVDRVAQGADRLLDGEYVADAATKALKTSVAGLTSVYHGIKQGIRTLFGNSENRKGGTSDE